MANYPPKHFLAKVVWYDERSARDRTAAEAPPPLGRQSLQFIRFPGRAWEVRMLSGVGCLAVPGMLQ